MMRTRWLIVVVFIAFLCAGCGAKLLPTSKHDTKTSWASYHDAKNAFDLIVPYQTTQEDLKRLGYDPFASPNVTLLTYIELLHRFLPNNSITKSDLDPGVQDCLAMKDACTAYEIDLKIDREERFGNVLLDLFYFRRKTKITGWEFNAFIVMQNGLVVYKTSSGKPNINKLIDVKKPLGPLQDIGGDALVKAAGF